MQKTQTCDVNTIDLRQFTANLQRVALNCLIINLLV